MAKSKKSGVPPWLARSFGFATQQTCGLRLITDTHQPWFTSLEDGDNQPPYFMAHNGDTMITIANNC